jgi:hypothetical protein
MRIDPLVCQKLLIAIEGDEDAGSGKSLKISVDGYDEKTIGHHVKYLFDEGFITGIDVTHNASPYTEILVTDITPAGRRFLDEREPEAPRSKIGF